MLPLLPLLLLQLLLPKAAVGCNNRVIVLHPDADGVIRRNGCRGESCKNQFDTGASVDTPPPTPSLTPSTPNPNTSSSTTTPVIPIPIGDCECGQGIKWEQVTSEDGTKQLNRPWMVHFRIVLENKEHIACSGSLINKRWIISAAHCFCVLNEHVQCTLMNRGFKKSATEEKNTISGVSSGDLNSKVNMTFGTVDLAQKRAGAKGILIEEIVIHPDYWSDKTKHGNSFDLALVKADRDIYPGTGISEGGMMLVHPICLPPFGPVDWEMTKDGRVEQHRLYTKGTGLYGWLRPDKPRIPFEDMDCKLTFKPEVGVPNPSGANVGKWGTRVGPNNETDVNAGWLNCHPDQFKFDPYTTINIDGRNSFITGFGSTAAPLSLNGLAPFGDHRVCRASSYSPGNSVFRRCKTNVCNKNENNPSLGSVKCQQLKSKTMPENGTIVARLEDGSDCFPWTAVEAREVSAFHHKPYTTGWCETVCDPDPDSVLYRDNPMDWTAPRAAGAECEVGPGQNWGWCTPGCDGSEDPKQPPTYFGHTFARSVHELPVDAFVYENCSIHVDTMTEFCTGSPITRGKTGVYDANGQLVRTEHRMFHPSGKYWNGNGTIIRLGARYQGRQHSSFEGDSCFGDAGGAVWKFHVFRSPKSTTVPDPRHPSQKLAVLTGVISRFEEMCGAFSPFPSQEIGDEPNLPTQHTVHARVVTHLNWIVSNVFKGTQCNQLKQGTKETPATTEPGEV